MLKSTAAMCTLTLSSYLPVLELFQADGTDGARVGAAGRTPGCTVALRARAALRAVDFDLQLTNSPHGLLMDGVLHAQEEER